MDCGIELFAGVKPEFDAVDYLRMFRKHPGVQYLADSGLFSIIDECLSNPVKQDSINEKLLTTIKSKKYLHPMFREIGILSDEACLVGACEIGKTISKEELLQIRNWDISSDFIDVLKYTTATKAINFIKKHIEMNSNPKHTIVTWLDYLKMAGLLGYDLTSTYIVFPSNLNREHDRLQEEHREHLNCIYEEQIKAMFSDLNNYYSYSDDKFFIRPPQDSCEIRNEGAILRHCVDRYIENVAKKETVILLIRKISDPDKPYFTVEFKKQAVRQCRGFCNGGAPAEVNDFLDKWLSAIERRQFPSELAA